MGNSLRCCIACVLPCGALDVIRIVHLNGRVEEFSRPVPARGILTAHPGHVLSTPCYSHGAGAAGRILIVSPEAELKRGRFYFLIPAARLPENKRRREKDNDHNNKSRDNNANYKHMEKVENGRKRSGRVGVWRPRLDSISEDPLS